MADNISVTPGAGAVVRAKQIAGVDTQIVQIDVGGEASELLLVADPALGVPVNIKGFPAGAVLVNNPTAANLKVDASGVTVPISAAAAIPVSAPVGTPAFVRLSDGAAPIATLPVSGTVTSNQGTPAAAAGAWTAKVTDGTTVAGVDAGTGGLKVLVVGSVTGGTSAADKAAFTEGTTPITPMGAELKGAPSAPADGQVGALRMTASRALMVNLQTAAGAEVGTAGAPVRVDPTGTTNQPVTQAVADWTHNVTKIAGAAVAHVGTGIQQVSVVDSAGTAFSAANPLYVVNGGRARTRVTKSVAITASQTGSVIWAPAGGKTFYVESLVLVLSVGGALTLFDTANAAGNLVFDGEWPVTAMPLVFNEPWASAAANNVLKYTTGASITGVLTVHGFEA